MPVSAVTGRAWNACATGCSLPRKPSSGRAAERALPPRRRSLLHARRRRRGRHRHGAVRRGRGRRQRHDQPVGPGGARALACTRRTAPTDSGQAGERCALNLAGEGVAKDAIHRGDVVLDPELHAPTDRIDAAVAPAARRDEADRPMVSGPPASRGGRGRRADRPARRRADRAGRARPGPARARSPDRRGGGDRFVMRDMSAPAHLGGGRFSTCARPRASGARPERMAQLDALAMPIRARARRAAAKRRRFTSTGRRSRAIARSPPTRSSRWPKQLGLIRIPVRHACVALCRSAGRSSARLLERSRPSMPTIRICRASAASDCACAQPRLPAPAFALALQRLARRAASRWTAPGCVCPAMTSG